MGHKSKIEKILFPALIVLSLVWIFGFWLSGTTVVDYRVRNAAKDFVVVLTLLEVGWAVLTVALAHRLWQRVIAGLILIGCLFTLAAIIIGLMIVSVK